MRWKALCTASHIAMRSYRAKGSSALKSCNLIYCTAGPGFTLTFELGNCTFDGKELLSKDGAIHCVGPSVILDRTPATFTSAYISAAKFVGQVSIHCIP